MGDDENTATVGASALPVRNIKGLSEIELLRECLREQTRVAQVNADALAKLSETMKSLAPIPVVSPNVDEIRNSKFEKLYMLWLKQSNFKEVKHTDSIDVCQWLLQLEFCDNMIELWSIFKICV